MNTLKDIRKRIGSVENTQKITRAMKMVSAAKLRGAQNAVFDARRYAEEMEDLVYRISTSVGVDAPPLMRRRSMLNRLDLIVISSDRGLCGGFNENLINCVQDVVAMHKRHGVEISLFVYGKKGFDACCKRKLAVAQTEALGDEERRLGMAQQVVDMLSERFLSGESDGAFVAYNFFLSTASQEVIYKDLLPLHHRRLDRGYQVDYVYEPSQTTVHEEIISYAIIATMMQSFRESYASELAARMMAMDAATKNADEMIEHLTMLYNRARQSTITRELMDIVNGAEALRA